MLESQLSRSAVSARLLLGLAAARGCAAEDALRDTGLTESQLAAPGAEIRARQEQQLIENLVAVFGEESDFAFQAGLRYRLEAFGLLGFAILSSQTLREVLEVSLRYQDLAFTLARARLDTTRDSTAIELDVSDLPPPVGRFAVEQCFASVWTAMTELGGDPPPVRIEFSWPRPATGDPCANTLGAVARYNSPADRMTFPNRYLNRIRPNVDSTAHQACERQCQELIAHRQARVGASGFVRERLRRAVGLTPSMEHVARDLNMSVRSLRRALAAEATSFRALEDQVRMQRAEEMLTAGRQTIEVIAHVLGYATAPAFVRAFKRSHHLPPGRWRRR
jgi:AraC-like DNA-binding protein